MNRISSSVRDEKGTGVVSVRSGIGERIRKAVQCACTLDDLSLIFVALSCKSSLRYMFVYVRRLVTWAQHEPSRFASRVGSHAGACLAPACKNDDNYCHSTPSQHDKVLSILLYLDFRVFEYHRSRSLLQWVLLC